MLKDKDGNIINPEVYHPTAVAFERWKESYNGRQCLKWPVAEIRFLENRLWHAFMAGVEHGEKKE